MPESLLCPTLVGRSRQLALVRSVLRGEAGQSCVSVVGGAGVGKSALTRAAVMDRKVLAARATPGGPTFRPLAELAVEAVAAGARVKDPALADLRGGLALLLPGQGSADLSESTITLVAAEALLALAGTLEDDVVLVLEDLHWADPGCLDALERICDRASTRRLRVVLVTRPGCPAADLVTRLQARRTAVVVEVAPLAPDQVEDMARRCLRAAPPKGLLSLLDAAQGHPFHIEELLRSAQEASALKRAERGWSFDEGLTVPIPKTLAESVSFRLEQLRPEDARLLAAAAVLGERVPLEAVAAAVPSADVGRAIRAGVALQLLDPASDGIAFRHALTSGFVAQTLLSHERRTLAAVALAAMPHGEPALLATLADLAGDRDRASRHRLDLARTLATSGQTQAALHELSLADAPSLATEVRVERVELLAIIGEGARALAEADLAEGRPLTPEEHVRVELARARCTTAPSVRHAAVGRALAGARGTPQEARVAATAAYVAVEAGDFASAEAQAELALCLAEDEPEVACQSLEVLGRVARGRDLDEARIRFGRGAAVAEANGLAVWRARALHEQATCDHLRALDPAGLVAARAAAVEAGAPGLIASVDFHLSALAATSFDGPRSLVVARRVIELAGAVGSPALEAMAWILVGFANVVSGKPVQARAALQEAVRRQPGIGEVTIMADFLDTGLGSLLKGDLEAAAASYLRAMRGFAALPGALVPLPPWYIGSVLLTVVDHDGHGEGAWARELSGSPELQVTTACSVPALLASAVAAGRAGDLGAAEEFSAQAATAWADKPGLDGIRHIACWLAATPALMDGWGRPVDWLFDAEAWAASLGYEAVAGSCRASLRNAGAAPRRRRGTTQVPAGLQRLGLTGREVDVLGLVAEGLTNSEIAARLHLSPGTVKGYVSQLLTKARVASRAALAALAAEHGLG